MSTMTERPQRRKMNRLPRRQPRCGVTEKIMYRDHDDAVKALRNARFLRGLAERAGVESARHERRAYRCEFCSRWHLTSRADRYEP